MFENHFASFSRVISNEMAGLDGFIKKNLLAKKLRKKCIKRRYLLANVRKFTFERATFLCTRNAESICTKVSHIHTGSCLKDFSTKQ